jgi:mono/diheme cytochrome c family protein
MRSLVVVRRGRVSARLASLGVAACAGFAAVAWFGWSSSAPSGYDPALRYPHRTDAIVLQPPPSEPRDATPVGNLTATLAGYAEVPGAHVVLPGALAPAEREVLTEALDDLFGTPAAPRVPDATEVGDLAMSPGHLAAGSQVYRRLCNQCHGLTGNGQGNAGDWIHPFPRDFRLGQFKIAAHGSRPSPGEIRRILREGVPGTRMQAYDLISDADLKAVTAYVLHLSQRGETELKVLVALADEEGMESAEVPALVAAAAKKSAADWQAAAVTPKAVAVTLPTGEDALRRGHELFARNCLTCHAGYGRAESFRYDAWGVAARLPDLTRGEWKWGREPADAVARIRNGIPAAAMPANPLLTAAEVLDLAAFTKAMSRPDLLPADVRAAVYPHAAE